uniref:WRKY DNA-binding transcription factor 70-like n=1 Tax=Erigeron canadensis TaxID=72917 RepID=UPI001CB99E7B|nr:WRKY DNA-binding transcription factor 70-like [Erigeron canadensis]
MLSEMEKNKKILTETLMKGRDSAKKLQSLRRRRLNFDGSVSVEDLLVEILASFTCGLSMLNSCDSDDTFGVPADSSVDQMPEVYSGKKPAQATKERRGCYKRRRTIDSRTEISSTFHDDYAWRKYGQKEILNSKFPRCYYRCTHKHVHGCKALKQVQQLEDESNKFHITYFGNHTCPSPNNFSHHGLVLNFDKDSKNHPYFSNSPSTITNIQTHPFVKQEVDSKTQSTDASDNISSANNDDHTSPALVWNDGFMGSSLMGFEYNHEDSCSSHSYLNLDFLDGDQLLDDVHFNEAFPQ